MRKLAAITIIIGACIAAAVTPVWTQTTQTKEQSFVEGLVHGVGGLAHGGADLVDLAFLNKIGNIGRVDHHLHGGDPLLIDADTQPLSHNGPQVQRQVHEDLAVGLLGKKIQYPVEGLVGAVGVQGGNA